MQTVIAHLVQGIKSHDPRSANLFQKDRTRGLKQIGARELHGLERVQSREYRIGFLNDVVDIDVIACAPHEPPPQ